MADVVHVNASVLQQAGASVADSLDRAARPGQVPLAMAGTSPADVAASSVAVAMGAKVTKASAELTPRGPQIREAAEAAANGFTAADEQNAERLRAVPATMTGGAATAGNPGAAAVTTGTGGAAGRIQMVGDDWDEPAEPWKIPHDWEDGGDGHFYPPIQIIPGAQGGGSGGRAPV